MHRLRNEVESKHGIYALLPCQRVRFALRILSFKHKNFSAKCTVTVGARCV